MPKIIFSKPKKVMILSKPVTDGPPSSLEFDGPPAPSKPPILQMIAPQPKASVPFNKVDITA